MLWEDNTCPATYLAHHELNSIVITIIMIVIIIIIIFIIDIVIIN